MQDLSLIEIISNSVMTMISSKVFMLFLLELLVLLIGFIFSKLMNKKVCKNTCIIASIIILIFYASNYYKTLLTFINNVSTKFIEFIYFPTTLEFVLVMVISLLIMVTTYIKSKNKILKFINTAIPVTISYLFFSIIEYINENNIPFNEFSVFTDSTLTSLYEVTMVTFISWIIGLIIYKVDMHFINKINHVGFVTVDLSKYEDEEIIELPKLKESKV